MDDKPERRDPSMLLSDWAAGRAEQAVKDAETASGYEISDPAMRGQLVEQIAVAICDGYDQFP